MFRKNRMNALLGEYLLSVGMCYRADLHMLGKMTKSDSAVSKAVAGMKEDGYVEEVKLGVGAQKKQTAYHLTKKGRIDLLDTIDDDYWHENKDNVVKDFHITNEKKVLSVLNGVRAVTAFTCASSPATPKRKPSLYRLYEALCVYSHEPSPATRSSDLTFRRTYADLSDAECISMLKDTGMYYTISEYREFCEQLSPGLPDTFHGSRARGFFLSMTNCYIVYVSPHGDNKMLKLGKFEQSLKTSMHRITRLTEVERVLSGFGTAVATEYGSQIQQHKKNDIHAIVISDGDSMVYSMAMGAPNGVMKKRGVRQKPKPKSEQEESLNMRYLDYTTATFERIFVIPFTLNGMSSLEYICHYSAEDWRKDSIEVSKKFPPGTFTVTNDSGLYPVREASGSRLQVIYLPAYEVKELHRIAELNYDVAIITHNDMTNAIAHSIRRLTKIYNAETGQAFGRDEILMYDKDGRVSGVRVIEDALINEGLVLNQKKILSLPNKFNYPDGTAFFNGVARGDIPTDMFLPYIDEAEEYKPKEKKHMRRKSITLTMGVAFVNTIYKAARLHNQSVSVYVKNLIHDQVEKDAEAYAEKIRTNRQKWKDS